MVVFFQGCARHCPGCFNPDTHPFEGGLKTTARGLFRDHYRGGGGIEGVTFSGGEPFGQAEGLKELLMEARSRGLTTVVYTGYTIEEIKSSADLEPALGHIDVLIDGPFSLPEAEPTLLARGSTNQRLHFLTGRYSLKDFYMAGKAEVTIGMDGKVTGTGFSRIIPRVNI